MLRSTLLAVLFAFSATTFADDFRYSSLTGSYGTIDSDGSSIDANIWALGLLFAVSDDFHLVAGYSTAESDLGNEVDSLSVGIGYHHSIADAVDIVGQVTYEYAEASAPGFVGFDDNGLGVGIGLRFAATDLVELNGSVNYADLGQFGDNTSLSAGVILNLTDSFSVGANGTWDDDISV